MGGSIRSLTVYFCMMLKHLDTVTIQSSEVMFTKKQEPTFFLSGLTTFVFKVSNTRLCWLSSASSQMYHQQ
jgi:hypothetical protein